MILTGVEYYAGIGSRETPTNIQVLMTRIARRLEQLGYVLRSGGAVGADRAFARGCSKKIIFRPRGQEYELREDEIIVSGELLEQAHEIAGRYHPYWDFIKSRIKKELIARNTFQILGADLNTPAKFVICWTVDGHDTGGTGNAIRTAWAYDIPVFNLYDDQALNEFSKYLKGESYVSMQQAA